METVANRLLQWLENLEAAIDELLRVHSRIWMWNQPGSALAVITSTPFGWEDLDAAGRNLQSRLLAEYSRWAELAMAVIAGSAESIVRDLATAQEDIRELIDQSNQTYYEDIGQARQGLQERLTEVRRVLTPLQLARSGAPLLIPDTNALLYEPRLEDWEFDDLPSFEIVLLPTVLAEIDDLKVNYRRDAVREKAERIVRQVKGYRTRGQLVDGVPLRKGRSTIRAVAVEPSRHTALSWLSWDSPDDRILSAVLEIMRASPGQAVALVTRDINLQNKADFARIPYLEPPDIAIGA